MKNPKIIWQKWQDELLDEIDDIDENDTNDFIEEEEEQENMNNSLMKKQTIVVTPMGILPYNAANVCLKNFNLWLAHTNFTITNNIANIVESVDGVESLDVFTRYRFRISVGKAFSDSLVMRDINTQLYEYIYEYFNK